MNALEEMSIGDFQLYLSNLGQYRSEDVIEKREERQRQAWEEAICAPQAQEPVEEEVDEIVAKTIKGVTLEEDTKRRKFHTQGCTDAQIAKKCMSRTSDIRYWRQCAGLSINYEISASQKLMRDRKEELIAMLNSDLRKKQIARYFRISTVTLTKIVRKLEAAGEL